MRLWEEHPGGVSPAGNRWLSLRTRLAWTEGLETLEGVGGYGASDYIHAPESSRCACTD